MLVEAFGLKDHSEMRLNDANMVSIVFSTKGIYRSLVRSSEDWISKCDQPSSHDFKIALTETTCTQLARSVADRSAASRSDQGKYGHAARFVGPSRLTLDMRARRSSLL